MPNGYVIKSYKNQTRAIPVHLSQYRLKIKRQGTCFALDMLERLYTSVSSLIPNRTKKRSKGQMIPTPKLVLQPAS